MVGHTALCPQVSISNYRLSYYQTRRFGPNRFNSFAHEFRMSRILKLRVRVTISTDVHILSAQRCRVMQLCNIVCFIYNNAISSSYLAFKSSYLHFNLIIIKLLPHLVSPKFNYILNVSSRLFLIKRGDENNIK